MVSSAAFLPTVALTSLKHLCCDNPSNQRLTSSTWEDAIPKKGYLRQQEQFRTVLEMLLQVWGRL